MRNKKYEKMNKMELGGIIVKKKKELFEYKYDVRIGIEKDYAQIKFLKKEIASMLSILKDKLREENINKFLNDLGTEIKKKANKKKKTRSAKKKVNLDKKKKDEKSKK